MPLVRVATAVFALLAALALAAGPAAATPAPHRAGHGGKGSGHGGKGSGGKGGKRARRCQGGKVAVRVGKRRLGCRKLSLRGAALGTPAAPAAALKGATRAIAAAVAHGKGSKRVGRGVKQLLASPGLRDLALLSRRVGSSARFARASSRLLRRRAAAGTTASASDLSGQVDLPGGWDGKWSVDPESKEFSMGAYKNGEGGTLTMRIPEADLERCPDVNGETAVRGGFTFALDAIGDARLGDGSKAFFHYALKEKSKSRAQTGDDAHLHDFDFASSAYQHVQAGLKDKAGKVLRTNPPWLATVDTALRYEAPFKEIEAFKSAFDRKGSGKDVEAAQQQAARDLLHISADGSGGGMKYDMTDEAWETEGVKAPAYPLAWTLIDVADTYDSLVREQNAHWLVDCLEVKAESPSRELAAGSTAPVLATVSPAHGGKVAPARVDASADVGTAAPASAQGGKDPVRFDYTAPSSDWKHGRISLRAVSKQGAGTGSFEFEAPHDTFALRFGVALDRQYLGGDEGVGSATWRGALETLLLGAPSEELSGVGPVPFGWSTFSLEDNGVPMVCQAGGYGHEDRVGGSSDPGSFEVTEVGLVEGEPQEDEVTIRFSAPLDHYTTTFHPDATTCGESSHPSSYRFLDGYRAWLGTQPGVKVTRPADPLDLAGQTYTIQGFQAGGGRVEARRQFDRTESYDDYQGSFRLTLELVRQEQG